MRIFLACRVSRSSVVEAWHSYLEQRKLAWNFKKFFIPHTETFGGALVLWVSPRTCNNDLVQLEGKTKSVSYEGWPYLLVPSQEWRNCLMLASPSPILQTRHFCSAPSDAYFVIFWSLKVILSPYARSIDSTKVIKPVSLEVKEFVWVPPNLSILKQRLVCSFHFFVSWPHNLIHVGLRNLDHENEVTKQEVGMTRLFKTLKISGFWMSKCAMFSWWIQSLADKSMFHSGILIYITCVL